MRLFTRCVSRTDAKDLQECCQLTLQDLDLCLFYQSPQQIVNHQNANADERAPYLEDSLVFKIVVMCMATVYRLQDTGQRRRT